MTNRWIIKFGLHALVLFSLGLSNLQAQGGVSGVHPSYSLVDLWSPSLTEEGIGDFDFLSDGRMVMALWGGVGTKAGKVLLLNGVSGSGPSSITVKTIAEKLNEPLGVKVVGKEIYLMLKNELGKLSPNPDLSYTYSTVYTGFSYNPGNMHQFSTNLIHKNGLFYFMATSSYQIIEEHAERGALIEIDPVKKTHAIFANGFREPNGLVLGPDNEFFATDNQGEFIVTNKLTNVQRGRFYGCHGTASPIALGRAETPPSLYLPYAEMSFSTSQPVMVTQGIFKDQMLVGDVHYGGINRVFLEKIKAADGTPEFQGSLFRFSAPGPFKVGINRLKIGPEGSIYVGGIGSGPDWHNWNYKGISHGFLKLILTPTVPFEMLAVRAQKNGFEIEFTKPVGDKAIQMANYVVQKYWHTPTKDYGGPRVGLVNVAVSSVTLSLDKKKAKVVLNGTMTAPNIYYLKLGPITSNANEALWNNEVWYTMLNVGQSEAPTQIGPYRIANNVANTNVSLLKSIGRGVYHANIQNGNAQPWEIRSLLGSIVCRGITNDLGNLTLPTGVSSQGPMFFSIGKGKAQITGRFMTLP